jgi:hypothetical protein
MDSLCVEPDVQNVALRLGAPLAVHWITELLRIEVVKPVMVPDKLVLVGIGLKH